MSLRHASWFGLCALVACASQDGSSGKDEAALGQTTPPSTTPTSRAPHAAGRLTPSNLPADICDTPGQSDLVVTSGSSFTILDPEGPCDALVPQADNLPPICVRKYANVTIGGYLQLISKNVTSQPSAMAIVATNTFVIEPGRKVESRAEDTAWQARAAGAPDPRGELPEGECCGGAGHVTAGAGVADWAVGGSAFGPTTGTQLVAGSRGGPGVTTMGPTAGGGAGGAIQLVSCGEFRLSGEIDVSGISGNGGLGAASNPGTGEGGGSGGTVVIEAARITGTGAKVTAVGGNGGPGGRVYRGSLRAATNECAGGAGGTGASLPQPGTDSVPGVCAAGAGGGSIGRIVINVPQGQSVPAIETDPPASIGVVGTH